MLPNVIEVLKGGGHMLLSLVVLIGLLIYGKTAMTAGFWSIVSVITLSFIKKSTRMSVVDILGAFESGIKSPASEIYLHEMPGGQFTNLKAQARSMGLEDKWSEIASTYADDVVSNDPTGAIYEGKEANLANDKGWRSAFSNFNFDFGEFSVLSKSAVPVSSTKSVYRS